MKLLNSFYAALGIGVTILATSIGIANKTLNPTQNVNSDLSYLTPQPAPVNPTNPSTTLPGTTISLKNTQLGTRKSPSKAQVPSLTNANAQWKLYDRPAQYPKSTTLPAQWVTMPDGTRLAVYVTLPADASGRPINEKFPVILIQSAYSAGVAGKVSAIAGGADPEMVKRGYATVVADVRGTGNSTGKWKLSVKLNKMMPINSLIGQVSKVSLTVKSAYTAFLI